MSTRLIATCRAPGIVLLCVLAASVGRAAGLTTWDGRHPIDEIAATVVYFVPSDRTPLPDWRERVEYFCRRIERFHAREFGGQSRLKTTVHPEPFRSARTTAALREGDANRIFRRTTEEVAEAIGLRPGGDAEQSTAFPVCIVLSDVNWRPLDDFTRLAPAPQGFVFDGSLSADGSHVPGAKAGGSRAVYLADRRQGRGLVSADGWRVPCRGSDCVVYHEGVGHAIGLPHPEPSGGSVMGQGQYRGWINESWIDEEQKRRVGWMPPAPAADGRQDLFTGFRVLPEPAVPRPGQPVALRLEWPAGTEIGSARVEYQTSLRGPWVAVPSALPEGDESHCSVRLGPFDRPCPVAYRARVSARDGETAEVWGYLQVRLATGEDLPPPLDADATDRAPFDDGPARPEVDLLALVDAARDGVSGDWHREVRDDGLPAPLVSPKAYGARIEIPYAPPEEYRLTVIAEPLDEPNGLILGQRSSGGRFLVLLDFLSGKDRAGAIENVDGKNVQTNPSRVAGGVFERGRPAEVVCTVRRSGVEVTVDGRPWIDWRGDAGRLSLSDYWRTPREETLFLGAYDCRYRFSRVTLTPLVGTGRPLDPVDP